VQRAIALMQEMRIPDFDDAAFADATAAFFTQRGWLGDDA